MVHTQPTARELLIAAEAVLTTHRFDGNRTRYPRFNILSTHGVDVVTAAQLLGTRRITADEFSVLVRGAEVEDVNLALGMITEGLPAGRILRVMAEDGQLVTDVEADAEFHRSSREVAADTAYGRDPLLDVFRQRFVTAAYAVHDDPRMVLAHLRAACACEGVETEPAMVKPDYVSHINGGRLRHRRSRRS